MYVVYGGVVHKAEVIIKDGVVGMRMGDRFIPLVMKARLSLAA